MALLLLLLTRNLLNFATFLNRTIKRPLTMFDGRENSLKGVCHIPMGTPFCNHLRELLISCARELKIPHHAKGTTVTVEGPRLNSLILLGKM